MTAATIATDLIAYNFDLGASNILARLKPLDHDLTGQTFMHELAREGDILSAEALMNAGCEIDIADEEGRRPLHEAALYGRLDMVKFLTRNGAQVDATLMPFGYTALYYAVDRGHHAIVRTLLSCGANLSVVDRLSGQGLLHLAAIHGDVEMAGILIASGVNVFHEDRRGQTARDLAARHNHRDMERTLLKVMMHHALQY